MRCRSRVSHFLFDQFGEIGWGSNSGFQAINLAIQFGAKRLILCGFDMSIVKGFHWHGRHQAGLNNPRQTSVDKWRIELDSQAPFLRMMGIEVLNASPFSALQAYPRVNLLEALRQ